MSITLTVHKKIATSLLWVFVIVGLALFSLQGTNITTPKKYVGQFVIELANYSILIYHQQDPTDFYKISPYDDVIFYEDGSWDKVISGNEPIQNNALVNASFLEKRVVWPLQMLLGFSSTSFTSKAKQLNYQIIVNADDSITVEKNITDLPKRATGFATAFAFSQNDQIIDISGKTYELTQETSDKIELPTPNLITLKNPDNTQIIKLPASANQRLWVDKVYRLVEIQTTFAEPEKTVDLKQDILIE